MRNINKTSFDESTKLKLKIFGECFEEWLPVFIQDRITQEIYIFDFFAGSGTDINGEPLCIFNLIGEGEETNDPRRYVRITIVKL